MEDSVKTINTSPTASSIPTPYFQDAFEKGNASIGEGSFGSVYEVTPTPLGLAFLRSQGLIGDKVPRLVVKSPNGRRTGDPRERENLRTWRHKGIVQFFGEFPDRDNEQRHHLVLEAMHGVGDGAAREELLKKFPEFLKGASPGEFWRYIMTRDRMSDEVFRVIAYQLLLPLQYLHSYDVAHRDLKAENILCGYPLINTIRGMAPTVKLSDFGTARALNVEGQLGISTRQGTTLTIEADGTKRWTGTAQYIAPELLILGEQALEMARELRIGHPEQEIHFTADYSTKCDIFSLGVTFFFMLTKSLPYRNANYGPLDLIEAYRMDNTTPAQRCLPIMNFFRIDPETIKLVLSMVSGDPNERPTAADLLNSSYFTSVKDDHGDELMMNE
jgi:serine/threonine protein kinase